MPCVDMPLEKLKEYNGRNPRPADFDEYWDEALAEMNAIASSIIGGTLLSGGVGNIIGTLFGVLSLSTIKNIVTSLGLEDAWWTNITVGGMLCIFLLIQSVILSIRNKKK